MSDKKTKIRPWNVPTIGQRVIGEAYDDTGWPDGTFITTSAVAAVEEQGDKVVAFRTEHTLYEVKEEPCRNS